MLNAALVALRRDPLAFPTCPTRECRPDVLIIGAPKAGTTALHAALARHPQIYASPVKEPKYYMCADAPPPAYAGRVMRTASRSGSGGGEDYAALFADAPEDALRLESTPFYLYLPDARRRIAEELPEARLIVVVRDPIDRAYSNWMHLWVDGLEPYRRLRRRLACRGRAGGRGLGAVLALPPAGPVRRAAGRPVRAGWTGSGCWCCATGSWSPSRPRR